jgi:hypothetical protein
MMPILVTHFPLGGVMRRLCRHITPPKILSRKPKAPHSHYLAKMRLPYCVPA